MIGGLCSLLTRHKNLVLEGGPEGTLLASLLDHLLNLTTDTADRSDLTTGELSHLHVGVEHSLGVGVRVSYGGVGVRVVVGVGDRVVGWG